MSKSYKLIGMLLFVLIFTPSIFGQNCTTSGLSYTSCFPWISSDGQIDLDPDPNVQNLRQNDTPRLNRAISATLGKLIFNEGDYFIGQSMTNSALPKTLKLYSYRILEGTGKSSGVDMNHTSSKIIQTKAGEAIFTIGANVYDVSIRDLAMVGRAFNNNKPDGTIGILATSTCATSCASIGFQFSNLKFSGLAKGIYVNAADPPSIPDNEYTAHQWQFDNVQLDHAFFESCTIGIHVNSYNSGWNIKSADFLVPNGAKQETDAAPSESITDKTYGMYFERITYSSLDSLIGNGSDLTYENVGTAFIYVKEHANLNIQNVVSEGFFEDLIVHGKSLNNPINLMNNTLQSGVRVKRTTLYSSSNQYSSVNDAQGANADAGDSSLIYSMGDKFCLEGSSPSVCDQGRGFRLINDSTNNTVPSAKVVFSTNQAKNFTTVPSIIDRTTYNPQDLPLLSLISNFSAVPLLRMGVRGANYDFWRDEGSLQDNYDTAGKMIMRGQQNSYSGYIFEMCQTCTHGNPETGVFSRVTINNNGSVTVGKATYLTLYTAKNGTLIYCDDCQESDPCSGGGGGAMAKRINGRWDCN